MMSLEYIKKTRDLQNVLLNKFHLLLFILHSHRFLNTFTEFKLLVSDIATCDLLINNDLFLCFKVELTIVIFESY